MTKANWLKAVNPALFLSFLVQAVTGIWLIIKPSGPVFELHERNGILFLLLVSAHLFLNWGWVRATFLKR
jgi:hypothetical protein